VLAGKRVDRGGDPRGIETFVAAAGGVSRRCHVYPDIGAADLSRKHSLRLNSVSMLPSKASAKLFSSGSVRGTYFLVDVII